MSLKGPVERDGHQNKSPSCHGQTPFRMTSRHDSHQGHRHQQRPSKSKYSCSAVIGSGSFDFIVCDWIHFHPLHNVVHTERYRIHFKPQSPKCFVKSDLLSRRLGQKGNGDEKNCGLEDSHSLGQVIGDR